MSVDHLYLLERWALISGYVYPTVCYFIIISFARNSIGQYYFYLVNSQTIWQAGSTSQLMWCILVIQVDVMDPTLCYSEYDIWSTLDDKYKRSRDFHLFWIECRRQFPICISIDGFIDLEEEVDQSIDGRVRVHGILNTHIHHVLRTMCSAYDCG